MLRLKLRIVENSQFIGGMILSYFLILKLEISIKSAKEN